MAPSPPLSLAKRTLAMVDSVLLPVQPKKIGIFADFIFAVSTMMFFFSSGESMEVSPVEPMISTALVPCCSWKRSRDWNAAKSTEPSLLNGVISATNEPVIFCLGISVCLPLRHGRACPGHPRLRFASKTWMPGTRPGMTVNEWPHSHYHVALGGQLTRCND